MKNKKSLLLALFAWALGSKASVVLLSQDFETGALPSGWSKSQYSGTVGWEFGNIGNYLCGQYFPGNSKIAISRDCSYESIPGANLNNGSIDRLVTPAMNLSAYDGVVVTFDYYFTYYEKSSASIEFTTDGVNYYQLKKLPRSKGWSNITMVLQGIKYSGVKLCFRHNDGNTSAYYFALDNLVVRSADAYDLSGIAVNTNEYLKPGNQPLNAKFVNLGANKIQELQFNYTLDGSNYITKTLKNLNIMPNDTVNLTIDSFAPLTQVKPYPTCITIMKANNVGNAGNYTSTICKLLQPMEYFPARKHLLEIGTSVPNTDFLNTIRFYDTACKKIPNVIPVFLYGEKTYLYSEDAMMMDSAMRMYGSGHMLDRERNQAAYYSYFLHDISQLKTNVTKFNDTISPAEIKIENIDWDSKLRKFRCTVKVKFLATYKGDARMNLYVVEDSVITGNPNGDLWNPDNNKVGAQYYNAGNRVINYAFPSVMRAAVGGYQGQNQVIPNYVPAAGKEYYYQFEYFVPVEWREDKIRLVATVNNWDNSFNFRRNLNAIDKLLVGDPTLGNKQFTNQNNVLVYPNPAADLVYVNWQGKNPQQIEVLTASGQVVLRYGIEPTADKTFAIPVKNLDNGLYMVRISGHGLSETRRVIVNK